MLWVLINKKNRYVVLSPELETTEKRFYILLVIPHKPSSLDFQSD